MKKTSTIIETVTPNTELLCQVRGEIIASNFPAFSSQAWSRINQPFELRVDADFDAAKNEVAFLKEFERSMDVAIDRILKEMEDIWSIVEGSRELKAGSAKKRLDLDAQVKARQKQIKEDMIEAGMRSLNWQYPAFRTELEIATKGKRTLATMQSAIDDAVREANELDRDNQKLIAEVRAEHGDAVLYSLNDLRVMPTLMLKNELERRIERHRAAVETAKLKQESESLKQKVDEIQAKSVAFVGMVGSVEGAHVMKYGNTPLQPAPELNHPLSADEEMKCFLDVVMAAFAPVKTARKLMIHPANIAKGEAFAEVLRSAWGNLNS